MVPWCHGAMVPCCLDAMAPRCQAALAPWCHGATVPSRLGTMVSWCHGATVPVCHGALGPWRRAALVPWRQGAMGPWCHDALVPRCHAALVPRCRVPCFHDALVPWCLGAMVSCCLGAMVPRCLAAVVPWCHGFMVPRCPGAMVPWWHGAMVSCCLGAEVPRCLGVAVPWCCGASVLGCRGAMVPWCDGAMVRQCTDIQLDKDTSMAGHYTSVGVPHWRRLQHCTQRSQKPLIVACLHAPTLFSALYRALMPHSESRKISTCDAVVFLERPHDILCLTVWNGTHATLEKQEANSGEGPGTTGLSPAPAPPSRGLGLGPPLRKLLQTTIRTTEPPDSKAGLFPIRSPLLRESLSNGLLMTSQATNRPRRRDPNISPDHSIDSQPRRILSASCLARVMSTPCHYSRHEVVLAMSQPRPRQYLCRDSALSMPVSDPMPYHRLHLASVNVMPAPCHRLCLASADVMPVPCHRLCLANADVMPVPLLHAFPRRCHASVVMSSVQGSLAITPACLGLAHYLSMAHVKANVHLDMAL
ncbi:hypothetical protein CQW23_35141 [Capsicum baccatum]|uniref:Uncharacterized protein n=1 Tax=Capsicum baccatum TaxID=33114 RepID=A0A2G2UWZ6_CAPBA|nr:hypothetical protein CQW23_35141 [Capsicum baccatum]